MKDLINISDTQVSLSPSGLRVLREVSINNYPLQVVEYKGERVVSSYDIANLHNKPVKRVNEQFERNKERLKEGVDYFLINKEEFVVAFGDHKVSNKSRHQFERLFTERGYLKLVKSFTDDLSWQVQDLLVDSYFKLKEIVQKDQYLLDIIKAKDELSRASALNAYELGYVQPLEEKADIYDAIIESKNTFSMANTAQIINIEKMGRNKLMAWLRVKNILKSDNTPFQKYINKGWFDVKLTSTVNGPKPCSRTTSKGVEGILRLLEH